MQFTLAVRICHAWEDSGGRCAPSSETILVAIRPLSSVWALSARSLPMHGVYCLTGEHFSGLYTHGLPHTSCPLQRSSPAKSQHESRLVHLCGEETTTIHVCSSIQRFAYSICASTDGDQHRRPSEERMNAEPCPLRSR